MPLSFDPRILDGSEHYISCANTCLAKLLLLNRRFQVELISLSSLQLLDAIQSNDPRGGGRGLLHSVDLPSTVSFP